MRIQRSAPSAVLTQPPNELGISEAFLHSGLIYASYSQPTLTERWFMNEEIERCVQFSSFCSAL